MLDPLEIFSEQSLSKLMRDEPLTKNDNFRLIFVTKSVLVPEIFRKTFEVIVVDDAKTEDEEHFITLTKKAPSKA